MIPLLFLHLLALYLTSIAQSLCVRRVLLLGAVFMLASDAKDYQKQGKRNYPQVKHVGDAAMQCHTRVTDSLL